MKKIGLVILGGFFFFLPAYAWAQADPYGRSARSFLSGQTKFKPGAYLHFRSSYTEDDDKGNDTTNVPDSFDIIRARLYVDGKIVRDVLGRFEYDFSNDVLLDAYIEMDHFPYADWTIRIGQFKVPLSEAGLALGTPLQETIKGPLIYEGRGISATPVTFSDRETGVLIRGDMAKKQGLYTFGVFNGNGINNPDDNDLKDKFFQFEISPWEKKARSQLKPLRFGAAYMVGEVNEIGTIGVDKRERYAFTAKYKIDQTIITYEYFLQTLDRDKPKEDITTKSWYIQLSQPYKKQFLKKMQKIQLIARYEFYDPDNTKDKDRIKAWTFGANWQVNEAVRLQLNYNIFKEDIKIDNNEILIQMEVKF